MNFPSYPTAQLVVVADFDPQLPARVLARFTVTGELPRRFDLRHLGDKVRVELEFVSRDAEETRRLAARVGAIPTVTSVDLSFVSRREAQAA